MVRINQQIEMLGMLALELLNQHLLLVAVLLVQEGLHVGFHRFGKFYIAEDGDVLESLDVAVLLAGDVRKEYAAVADFADRLVERDADPLALAAFAGPLEHLAEAVWVISRL